MGTIKKKKKHKFSKLLTLILLGVLTLLFGAIIYLNVIPLAWTLIAIAITAFIVLGIILLNFNRTRIWRMLGNLCSMAIIGITIFGEVYLFNTMGFLFSLNKDNYDLKTYNVLVLNSASYKKIDDLDGEVIGINEVSMASSLESARSSIQKKIDPEFKDYEDTDTLVSNLLDENVAGIILEDSELNILKENNVDDYNNLNNIYQIEIKDDINNIEDAININKEPFNVYISGIDTFGKINQTSRSDVNIVVTVNPVTEKVLITWIPRDYYININNNSMKDKLTHAGIYGVDSSIYAIEKLLDTKINYYVKVNFTSVIKAIDVLEGVTVYNDETFTSEDNFKYPQGEITLDGERALSFVRERHHVTGGDLGRGKNQIKVLEAVINKARSKAIITKYNSLLKTLEGSFTTNASQSVMLGFVKKEIQRPRNWQIESQILTGTDGYEYTYSYKNNKLYVMIPDEEVVENAINKIKETEAK